MNIFLEFAEKHSISALLEVFEIALHQATSNLKGRYELTAGGISAVDTPDAVVLSDAERVGAGFYSLDKRVKNISWIKTALLTHLKAEMQKFAEAVAIKSLQKERSFDERR